MTTMIAPELDAGLPYTEAWRFVAESDPALVARWEAAQATFDREEKPWQARAADWRRRAGSTAQRPESRFGRALREAREAIGARVEQMIEAGELVYAGYPSGVLDGDPQVIPISLLGALRPRGSTCTIRGTVFHELRLFRAADLAAAAPEPDDTPPATMPGLVKALASLFAEDVAWTAAGTQQLAQAVAARDQRFQPNHGPAKPGRWNAGTLAQRIREVRVEARQEAGV